MVASLEVGAVAVAGQVECGLEVGLHSVEVGTSGVQARFDDFQLPGDAVLLGFQQFKRYCSGIVGLEQAGPFAGQLLALVPQFAVECCCLGAGDCSSSVRLASMCCRSSGSSWTVA